FPYAINDSGIVAGYYVQKTGSRQVTKGFTFDGSLYTTIMPPGATKTYVDGISASGKLAGYAINVQDQLFNFVFSNGKYQLISIPNASFPAVLGISPSGVELVGEYSPVVGGAAGFLYQNKA